MLKTLRLGRKAYHGVRKTEIQKRLFLSESYRCDEAWKTRLNSPVLQNVKPLDLYFEMEQRFSTTGNVHAIDVDIFMNVINRDIESHEILETLRTLRLSSQATDILDSTHHATIRYMLDSNHHEELLKVLHDRITYGIFPDYVCYNLLMDTFIKKQQYGHAARVAVLPMLQEDLEHPITNALAVYSCHKYLEHTDQWQKPVPPEETDEEEVKVRVTYLRNPYFDDHFDLTDPLDLVGKTLAFEGRHMNDALGRSCQLRGLLLYKKYGDALKLVKKWIDENQKDVVYKEVLDLIQKDGEHIPEDQITDDLKEVQSQLTALGQGRLCQGSMVEAMENNIKSAVDAQAEKDIARQCKEYITWESTRASALKEQTIELETQARLNKLKGMKKELEDRERVLTFFERQEAIEMEIERKDFQEEKERKRISKIIRSEKKLRKLKEAEVYTPPEI